MRPTLDFVCTHRDCNASSGKECRWMSLKDPSGYVEVPGTFHYEREDAADFANSLGPKADDAMPVTVKEIEETGLI